MTISEKLEAAYASAQNYPDLAARLKDAGVLSYTVDVSSHIILYRFDDGQINISEKTDTPSTIGLAFNQELTIQTIRNNQQGLITYMEFMQEIANAGVRFYEATLSGNNPRITYIGIGGFYEDLIPIN